MRSSEHCYRPLSTVLSNGFSAYGYNFTDLSLASIQHLPELDTRLPDLSVCSFDPIKAFVGYPFPAVFTRFRGEKYAYSSANRNPGCHIFTCHFHVSPFLDARFGVIVPLTNIPGSCAGWRAHPFFQLP
jgi:hypothetical protein